MVTVKKLLEGKQGGGRKKKLRLRWLDYVELDFRNVGIRIQALDRTEWASVVREAKAKLKGWFC
jgi:hypothetical protein